MLSFFSNPKIQEISNKYFKLRNKLDQRKHFVFLFLNSSGLWKHIKCFAAYICMPSAGCHGYYSWIIKDWKIECILWQDNIYSTMQTVISVVFHIYDSIHFVNVPKRPFWNYGDNQSQSALTDWWQRMRARDSNFDACLSF